MHARTLHQLCVVRACLLQARAFCTCMPGRCTSCALCVRACCRRERSAHACPDAAPVVRCACVLAAGESVLHMHARTLHQLCVVRACLLQARAFCTCMPG